MTDPNRKREYDIQYFRERYSWRKSMGICTNCGNEKADRGHVLCLMCRMDMNERNRNRDAEAREKDNMETAAYHRKVYKERTEKGLCTRCGKRTPKENLKICAVCSAKQKAYYKEWRNKKGIMPRMLMGNGEYCYICGKPGCNGKKTCPECHERQAAIIMKVGNSSPKKDHPWRRMIKPECSVAKKKGEVKNG